MNRHDQPKFNCDQAFAALTRGAFPTADPADRAVEDHLHECASCRRLAAALRPALDLLQDREACAAVLALPSYWGAEADDSAPAVRNRRAPGGRSRLAGAAIAIGAAASLLIAARLTLVATSPSAPAQSALVACTRTVTGTGQELADLKNAAQACCTQCHAAAAPGPQLASLKLAAIASRCGECHVN